MSIRRGEDDLLHLIKSLQSRLAALENQGERTRRNDIRIGNLLISWDDTLHKMTLKNLKTAGPLVTVDVP